MEIATTVATSRIVAMQRALDVTADNLANSGTSGFKAERMLFSDWLLRQPDGSVIGGERQIAYTQDRATWRDQRQGALVFTQNPFDVALTGGGFFTVSTPAGVRLTRAGRFAPLPDGSLADMAGNKLLDTGGQPIVLAVGDTDNMVSIAGDGTVSDLGGQIGKIGVVLPSDLMRMTAEGSEKLRADTPTAPVPFPKMVQGALEDSNVQPIGELVRMMDAQRQFQFVASFIQAESDRQQSAIDKLLPKS
jgi:flagellar basal-body rod protein FlgF